MQLITGRFPAAGLTYPKFHDNPPFQTFEEVQRRIAAGGLKPVQIAELWDALYLTLPETKEILAHVHGAAAQPWLHPMLCFAAYTGARRAEMLRALVSDVDLDAQTVLIREKKRAKGRTTTRRIPLTPTLSQTLHEWIHDGKHPGGQHLFSQRVHVIRSKTKRTAPTPITEDEAHDHFKRTFRDTKWETYWRTGVPSSLITETSMNSARAMASSVSAVRRFSSILSSNAPRISAMRCYSGSGGSSMGTASMIRVLRFGMVAPTAWRTIHSRMVGSPRRNETYKESTTR